MAPTPAPQPKFTTKTTIEPVLLSRKAAASALSISLRGLDYLVARKALTTRRIGSRVLVPTSEVRRMAREDHPFALAG